MLSGLRRASSAAKTDAMYHVHRLAHRPDLREAADELDAQWPKWCLIPCFGSGARWCSVVDSVSDWLVMVDKSDSVIGRAVVVQYALGQELGRPGLPSGGMDAVVQYAAADKLAGRKPTHISAIEIVTKPEVRASNNANGPRTSSVLLQAVKAHAKLLGFDQLALPLRPTNKHLEPHASMAEYVARVRPDGLPADPWIRRHVLEGGSLGEVCHTSWTINGTLEEWRASTDLPFDRTGQVEVPGGLTPVHVNVESNHAVYVEANVWMVHPVAT